MLTLRPRPFHTAPCSSVCLVENLLPFFQLYPGIIENLKWCLTNVVIVCTRIPDFMCLLFERTPQFVFLPPCLLPWPLTTTVLLSVSGSSSFSDSTWKWDHMVFVFLYFLFPAVWFHSGLFMLSEIFPVLGFLVLFVFLVLFPLLFPSLDPFSFLFFSSLAPNTAPTPPLPITCNWHCEEHSNYTHTIAYKALSLSLTVSPLSLSLYISAND